MEEDARSVESGLRSGQQEDLVRTVARKEGELGMRNVTTPPHLRVTPALRRVGSIPILVAALVATATLLQPEIVTATAQQGPELESEVVGFVTQIFVHGVPYEEAHRLGPKALPILKRLLGGEEYVENRPAIVATIAFIGTPESFAILHSFLWDRFEGEVDARTYQALLATPSVMGTIPTPEATSFLVEAVDPERWSGIRWSYGPKHGAALGVLLSKLAINGLSYTGNKRGREVLEQLRKKPYSEKQIANIEEGIKRHAEISAKGLPAYLRSLEVSDR